MRSSRIMKPINKTLLTEDRFVGGRKVLIEDDGFAAPLAGMDVALAKAGQELQSIESELFLEVRSDLSPPHPVYRPPSLPEGGLRPNSFIRPAEVRYSFENPTTQTKSWMGQDSYAIKTYQDFKFSETDLSESMYLANPRMFEHLGELYFLAERREKIGDQTVCTVTLYQLNEEGCWFTRHKFLENPVDIWDYDSSLLSSSRRLQSGSPSGLSAEGDMYISYRSVDRSSGLSYVVVYRLDDDEFNLISRTPIPNAEGETGTYDQYRLRMAYGCGVFMFVSFGYNFINSIKDFRTFVSFDKGYTLTKTTENYKNVIQTKSVRFENTSSIFAVEDLYEASESTEGTHVHFDLCFDIATSNFLLVKGGDSIVASPWLIAMIAPITNPFNWDQVLKQKLEGANIGYADNELFSASLDIQHYDPESVNRAVAPIRVRDVCLISNGNETFLYLSCRSEFNDFNTALTKIALVDSSSTPKGYASKIIAYGQKLHPRVIFLMDPINLGQTGFAHGGTTSGWTEETGPSEQICWINLMGSFWRNQLVYTAQMSDVIGITGNDWVTVYSEVQRKFLVMAVAGKHSNLAEEHGYELSFAGKFGRSEGFNLAPTLNNGTRDLHPDGYCEFTHASGPNPIGTYMEVYEDTKFPSILKRARLSTRPMFKARIQMKYSGFTLPTQSCEFFKWDVQSAISGSVSVVTVRVFVRGDGGVFIANHDFATSPTICTLDPDVSYDISIITDYTGRTPKLTFSFKEEGALLWNIADVGLDFTAYSSGVVSNTCRIGIVSGVMPSSGFSVSIKDVHLSVYSSGYKPLLTSYDSFARGRRPEYVNGSSGLSYSGCRPMKVLTPYLELYDGSIVSISGVPERTQTSKFVMRSGRQANSIKNTMVDNSTLPYNYTSVFDPDTRRETFLFRNEDGESFESIAVINSIGSDFVTVKAGRYDEFTETWLSYDEMTYEWPYRNLTPTDYYNEHLIVSESFESHELEGLYLYAYNEVYGVYDYQTLIIDNDDSFVTLRTPLTLDSDHSYRLLNLSAIFDWPFDTIASHVEITMHSFAGVAVTSIANIEIGTFISMSGSVSEIQDDGKTIDSISSSDRGYTYQSYVGKVALSKVMDVTLPNISTSSSEFASIMDVLSTLKRDRRATVIELYNDESDIRHGVVSDLSVEPSGYELDLSFGFESASFNNDLQDYQVFPAFVSIELSEADLIAGSSFIARALSDRQDLSYTWDFGDGSSEVGAEVFHSYSEEGRYILMLTYTDTYGNTGTKSISVYVKALVVQDIVLSFAGSGAYTLYFTLKDKDGATVPDSSMSLSIIDIFPAVSSLSSLYPRFTNGVAQVTFTSSPSLTTVKFIDSEGRSWLRKVTLT